MNSMERLKKRLCGEPVDRALNFDIFMTFAAHYIQQPLSRYYQDYRVLCDANFAVQEAFDLDILQAISDPYREAADFGLSVHFPQDNLPLAQKPLLEKPQIWRNYPIPTRLTAGWAIAWRHCTCSTSAPPVRFPLWVGWKGRWLRRLTCAG
jgi:uroporphyrinogen-III decarboxylase